MTTTNIPSLTSVMTDQTLFAETFLRILDKDKRLVPLRYYPIQRHSMRHETRRTIKIKPRQGTFTTMEASKIFKDACTKTITSITLAHLDVTTQAIRRMAERFYDKWPSSLPKPLRALANDVITTYPDTGSECIVATAGSTNVGHGLTINRAHLSEVSRWRDAKEVMQGVLQAIPANGRVSAESTTNGQQGWFYEMTMETLDSTGGQLFVEGKNGWSVQFYPWWWAQDYATPLDAPDEIIFTDEERALMRTHNVTLTPEQIKWRRIKMLEEKDLFFESYPEDIHTCFLSGDATSVFRNVREVATARVYADAAAYRRAHPQARFVMGVDWGREQDYSVFTVMDVTTWHVVAMHRVRHLDWHIQRARLMAMHQEWGCERIVAERNSIGDVNISALLQDNLPVQAFYTSPRSKKMIIDSLALALEAKDIRLLPDTHEHGKVMIAELMGYQQKKQPSGDYTYEGKPHDDCVISLALALFAINQSGVRL